MYFDYVQAIFFNWFSTTCSFYLMWQWKQISSKCAETYNCSRKKKRLLQFDQSLLSDCFALPALCDENLTFGSYKKLCWKIQDFHML